MPKLKDTFLFKSEKISKKFKTSESFATKILNDLKRNEALATDRLKIISNIFKEIYNFKKENPEIDIEKLENRILEVVNKN